MAHQEPIRSMIRPVLLLPKHVEPTSSNAWLLTQMKDILNLSYAATYCAQPTLFGSDHTRIADLSQIADIVGSDGFTLVLILNKTREEDSESIEIAATVTIKNFGDGDINEYFKWTKNIGGKQWADKSKATGKEQQQPSPLVTSTSKPEVTALGVHPNYQKLGLGVTLLKEIEWLLMNFPPGRSVNDGGFDGLISLPEDVPSLVNPCLKEDQKSVTDYGIDIVALRQQMTTRQRNRIPRTAVLTCVRELGNEAYYEKRGYKTVHTGMVPVGMWDSKKECTMAYMEKQLL